MTLTPEEGRRLHVLTLLEGKRITPTQAAEALGLTLRQIRRLRALVTTTPNSRLQVNLFSPALSPFMPPRLPSFLGRSGAQWVFSKNKRGAVPGLLDSRVAPSGICIRRNGPLCVHQRPSLRWEEPTVLTSGG